MAIYKIAAHTGTNDNGYIQYDADTRTVQVHLCNDEINRKVYEYLTTCQTLHNYVDLSFFETIKERPVDSWETMRLALAKVWMELGVHIDWSRKVD